MKPATAIAFLRECLSAVGEYLDSWRNLFQTPSGRVKHLCPECGEMKVPLQDWQHLILTCPDCRGEIEWRQS